MNSPEQKHLFTQTFSTIQKMKSTKNSNLHPSPSKFHSSTYTLLKLKNKK